MMPDGNGGGPVVIPKVYNGRNKTFWYSGYSKLIEKKTQAYTSVTPTPAELHGDFTFGGAGQPLYDPATTRQNADGTWTRDPFPTAVIPQSRFDPVYVKILSYNIWRAPNMAGTFSSTGPVSNFTYNPPSRTYDEDFSERVDHQVQFEVPGCMPVGPTTMRTDWNGPPAFRLARSMARPAITLRLPSRTHPSARRMS